MMSTSTWALPMLLCVGLLARWTCANQGGSCRTSNLCCPGRDSSCVVQKAPINAIIEDLSDKPCYCDHACLALNDCCHDFKQACNVIDCEVSDWGPWSECDVDCGTGTMSRSRSVIHEAENGGNVCPELMQRRGCHGTRCPDHHNKAGRETALILPSTFSHIRTMNATHDIRKNLRLKYPKDPVKDNSKQYCVEFEVTKASKGCHKGEDAGAYKALHVGQTVCVQCEDTAMRKYLGYRCKGHGMEDHSSRFNSMNHPSCHGRWIRRNVHDTCPCVGGANFIFV